MSSEPSAVAAGAVRLEGVTKRYRRGGAPSLAELLVRRGARTTLDALSEVDLEVAPGEAVGIIGPNGSGKSTLLKLLAGVTEPTEGRVACGGRIGSMIELELGFHGELTGIENVRTSAALAGLAPAEVRALLPAVVDFAGIGDAVEAPLKHYSTGMRARLGFSLATHLPVDVLLVDEVLAVGDVEFQQRCLERIVEVLDAGTTLLFVSHEMYLIDTVCHRAVHLNDGRVIDDGPAAAVIDRYLEPAIEDLRVHEPGRVAISSVEVRQPTIKPWEPVELEVELDVREEVVDPVLALEVSWKAIAPEVPIGHAEHPVPAGAVGPGRHRLVATTTPIPLDSGHARLEVAVLDGRERHLLDAHVGEFWIDGPATRSQPSLAVDVTWELERTGTSRPEALAAPASDGPVAARLRDVVKRYGGRWHGSRSRAGAVGADGDAIEVRALDGVTLDLARGQVTGIIGPNGAGKTTLLRVLAGVTAPTSGSVEVHGRVVSMLDLGLGFHPDLTGLENVRISGRLLGLTVEELEERLPAVLDFAGIGVAVEQPVRQYSTGMQARLGLALAMHTDPDVLLIDESLAVGDQEFRARAIDRLHELCRGSTAGVFVSHELDVVAEVATRVVRLDRGQLVDDGPVDDVLGRAGGRIADRGTRQVTNEVRLYPLELAAQHIAGGEPLVVEGDIEVTTPSPHVRLEVSYRAHPDLGPAEIPAHERGAHTMMAEVVEPVGGRLSEPGWYRHRVRIDRNAFLGDVFVVLTAVDEIDGTVVAETWHDVVVGARAAYRTPHITFEAEWRPAATPAGPLAEA